MKCRPWFRSSDGWWYGQVGQGYHRRHVRLVQGRNKKRAANRRYKELLETEIVSDLTSNCRVVQIFKAFLRKHSRRHCEPATHVWYRDFLKSFAKRYGALRVSDLKPIHVTDWLNGKDWNQTTHNRAITCVKVAINWAVNQGIIKSSPLKTLKKPPIVRRDRILTAAERRLILSAVKDKAFKLFLFALGTTAARPGEIRRVTAQHFHAAAGLWIFTRKHKTAHHGKTRTVYLTPALVKLCQRLARENPTGSLFRNTRGQPWTRNAIRLRFRNLRDKFPQLKGVVSYCYRHTWTTDALERGLPVATVAELLGHADTKMVAQFYGHLSQKADYLRAAAIKAIRPHPLKEQSA